MDRKDMESTPAIVQETIDRVIKKMRFRKKVRADVRAELEGHFQDALADCRTAEEQQKLADALIKEFGDVQVLATLIRRAKKRCRPAWAKVLIRASQVTGLCALYVLLCVSRLYIGEPTVKVDTIAKINETVKQGHDDALNAHPGMQTAAGLLTAWPNEILDHARYTDTNDAERQVMDAYLAENEAALDVLMDALKKPYYWRQYNPVRISLGDTGAGSILRQGQSKTVELSSHMLDQVMTGLSEYKMLATTLRIRAERFIVRGDVDRALVDAKAIIRFADHLFGSGMFIEQLVGTALMGAGTGTVMYVVSEMDPNEQQLAQTYSELEVLFEWDRPIFDHSIEKAMIEDMIQRGFTDDGQGNGRPLASSGLLMAGSPGEWWKNLLLFDYPDRKQVVKHVEQLFNELFQGQIQTPWTCRDQAVSENEEPLTIYSKIIEPALERAGVLQWRSKMGYQVMLTVLAIKHYEARHGVLPHRLEQVVTDGLLKVLPRDFYGDGPLTYQRKSDTEFVLYSWGVDLKDDSGRPSTNSKGVAKLFYPEGDWVFWPIAR
jgi:hypothetical protein